MAVAAAVEGVGLTSSRRAQNLSAVKIWLYVLAALVVAMVAVGGATRLTGSGLSITEWKPVTGALPPLTEQAWQTEFEKYRQIPQYELVNKGMTLSEFKFIYGWEWSHASSAASWDSCSFSRWSGSGIAATSRGGWRSRSWESARLAAFREPSAGSWSHPGSSPA